MNKAMRICETCGKRIPRDPKWKHSYYAKRRFCNRGCRVAFRPDITYDYIAQGDCWVWQGYVDRNGYGRAYDATLPPKRRTDWAHRVSYRRHRGEIPAGMELDHTCQNTLCINPEHLEPVTKAEHAARTMRRLGKDDLHARAGILRRNGLTYDEISEALDLAGRSSAASAVKAAITKGLIDPKALPPRRSLSLDDRADIQSLNALGVPQGELAAWYGVDCSQISRVCSLGRQEAS